VTTTTTDGRGRSIWAVAAGFLATAVLSLGLDVVMHATGIFPGWGQPMSDGLFVWATAYRMAFTILGGYVAARLAPRNARRHVLVLGILGSIAATIGLVATWNAGLGPRWYPVLLLITAMPCVWAGGRLSTRTMSQASSSVH
jgi:MFS family permease